jgi:hypothetical protein
MRNKDNINSLIERVDSILSDIEHRKNLDSVGDRYSELKGYVENEIKSCKKESASDFVETVYLPALSEFVVRLKPKKGASRYPEIYDALLDGVGLLKWYMSENS